MVEEAENKDGDATWWTDSRNQIQLAKEGEHQKEHIKVRKKLPQSWSYCGYGGLVRVMNDGQETISFEECDQVGKMIMKGKSEI